MLLGPKRAHTQMDMDFSAEDNLSIFANKSPPPPSAASTTPPPSASAGPSVPPSPALSIASDGTVTRAFSSFDPRLHCRLCKEKPRKSARITFCDTCKKQIDKVRNTYKENGRLQQFIDAYNGQDEMLRSMVEEAMAHTQRDDGRKGRGVHRVKWDMARYEEKKESAVEHKDGFRMEYIDEQDLCDWWQRKERCTNEEAKHEWDSRLDSPATKQAKYPETGNTTIGLWKRYWGGSTSMRNTSGAVVGLKEFKRPTEDRIDALQGNTAGRLSFDRVILETDKSACNLLMDHAFTQYCKNADVKTDADKKPEAGKKKAADADLAAEQASMKFELKLIDAPTAATSTITGITKQARAALKEVTKVTAVLENAISSDPMPHNAPF